MKWFKTGFCLVFMVLSIVLKADTTDWLTQPERTEFRETSSYDDVSKWLAKSALDSEYIRLTQLTMSTEGRPIPLMIIGPSGVVDPPSMRLRGLESVLVVANIHAGEVEGKEACMMVLRDMVRQMPPQWIKNQVILMVPIFNPDGNEKMSPRNRGDKGPDQAGVRYNGQFLDLNRDYLKVDSPEVHGLIHLFRQWDPILFFDMHTTNGSYHQHSVTYSTASNPNGDETLNRYMWDKMLPSVCKNLKEQFGHEAIPYGNFADWENPGDGEWVNDTFEARYGTNYYGLWNRFTLLDENYAHADFKTRIMGAYGLLRSVLDYTAVHITEMAKVARESDLRSQNLTGNETFISEFSIGKLSDFTIKSYEFTKEAVKAEDRAKYPPWIKDFIVKPTDRLRNYKVTYKAKALPKREIPLPYGYILLPHRPEALRRIKAHGITFYTLTEETRAKVERFKMSRVKVADRLYQGITPITVEGQYESLDNQVLPKGAIFIPLAQRLRRLIPILLEPDHVDSLVSWGTFNRELVSQWGGQPLSIPVFRLPEETTFPMILGEPIPPTDRQAE